MKKKIITLCLVIAMLSVAVIGGTLAYFTDVDQATNEFTVGGVKIDLWEEVNHVDGAGFSKDGTEASTILGKGNDEYVTHAYTAVMPGDTLTKKVTVENTDEEAVYVALAIQQNNYGIGGKKIEDKAASWDFNNRIDDYYEGSLNGYTAPYYQEASDFTYETEQAKADAMQGIISDIFSGDGWNKLAYTKTSSGPASAKDIAAVSDVRYYPTKVAPIDQDGSERYVGQPNAALIAVDYSVAQQGKNSTNMLDAKRYDECANGTRIWVYYLYLPKGASYTLDLTITVPKYIDEYSIKAFQNMILDVRASAIQASGFASAKLAFEALEDVYSYNYTPYVTRATEDEEG